MAEGEGGGGKESGVMSATRSLTMVSLAMSLGQAGFGSVAVARPVASATTIAVTDQADLPLQAEIFEPFTRQIFAGAIGILYKANLDQDPRLEQAIPGVHAAMIEAALTAGSGALEGELTNAKSTARKALHGALTSKELGRLAYLYGPFVTRNRGRDVLIRTGVTVTAATEQWLSGLAEDQGYQSRLRQVAAEPGMVRALNLAVPIMTEYQKRLTALGIAAVQTGIAAAKARANAMASAKGLASPYPGALS